MKVRAAGVRAAGVRVAELRRVANVLVVILRAMVDFSVAAMEIGSESEVCWQIVTYPP